MAGPTAAGWTVPELTPERCDYTDCQLIQQKLAEDGYAVIKAVASPQELEHARELLWENHLHNRLGWDRKDPQTWTDSPGVIDPVFPYADGIMVSSAHCEANWYVRSLPRMIGAFAAVYGTDEIVAAYDAMSINRPTSTGAKNVQERAATVFEHGKLNGNTLHTHFDQEGYGGDELIAYGIVSLWDMNKATGATAIVPRSHLKVAEITQYRQHNRSAQLDAFTAFGLTPAILNCKAGDLCLFDTALYHCGCDAADPTGATGNGPDQLLRAICICSMSPTRLLAPYPHIFEARRRAYELDVCE